MAHCTFSNPVGELPFVFPTVFVLNNSMSMELSKEELAGISIPLNQIYSKVKHGVENCSGKCRLIILSVPIKDFDGGFSWGVVIQDIRSE